MMESLGLYLSEKGWIPDASIRKGIQRLCRERQSQGPAPEELQGWIDQHIDKMNSSPIAILQDAANTQHYEVPAEFFHHCLGPRLKYSSCLWEPGDTLADAEIRALQATTEHADLHDGQEILELGCGWGSLTLWMAEQFPNARITGVSNSNGQRESIEHKCRERGLHNVQIITADVNQFQSEQKHDRVVSIEMFEHMRNWRSLLQRIRGWVHDDGRLMIHVFCHRHTPYFFEDRGSGDWMARHFFSGGLMPSLDLPRHFTADFEVEESWEWDGTHYEQTANAWLACLDKNRKAALACLKSSESGVKASVALQRWRMFFMACAELFGLDEGQSWLVGHYRLAPTS
ncbi:MAG: cyclopropane-fatty-acyl-phospholipid synthase family protein [Phycisphaerales bacterium]|nr:cyclopropane-fatty-acyl-phospholipid synthase family protein [Phycisphaerales bacterium]